MISGIENPVARLVAGLYWMSLGTRVWHFTYNVRQLNGITMFAKWSNDIVSGDYARFSHETYNARHVQIRRLRNVRFVVNVVLITTDRSNWGFFFFGSASIPFDLDLGPDFWAGGRKLPPSRLFTKTIAICRGEKNSESVFRQTDPGTPCIFFTFGRGFPTAFSTAPTFEKLQKRPV